MSQDLDVRIAKVKGWTDLHTKVLNGGAWGYPPVARHRLKQAKVPCWSSSLDLMQKLEGELDTGEREHYLMELIHTAEQKAQAWLKVKEK